jgi:hypothetical protein
MRTHSKTIRRMIVLLELVILVAVLRLPREAQSGRYVVFYVPGDNVYIFDGTLHPLFSSESIYLSPTCSQLKWNIDEKMTLEFDFYKFGQFQSNLVQWNMPDGSIPLYEFSAGSNLDVGYLPDAPDPGDGTWWTPVYNSELHFDDMAIHASLVYVCPLGSPEGG